MSNLSPLRPPVPPTIIVDTVALGLVLHALLGPEHAIREMFAIRSIDPSDPIGKLIEQYNEQVRAHIALHSP